MANRIVLYGEREQGLLFDAETNEFLSDVGETLLSPAQVKMLAQEGGPHSHTSDTDETVIFRLSVKGEMMGKNGKIRQEFLASNEGTGDVTFRAYFGPAESAPGDDGVFQVGADTVIAEGHRQRCSLEIQNAGDAMDQGETPNVPMNTPDAAFTDTVACAVNTNADCDLILTGQCASTDGIVNATSITVLFIDPPDTPSPPWAVIWDSHVRSSRTLHISPTGLFGGALKVDKGDWVRISHGDRKLTEPFQAGVWLIWDTKLADWNFTWVDENGVGASFPFDWWMGVQPDPTQDFIRQHIGTLGEGGGADPDGPISPTQAALEKFMTRQQIANQFDGTRPPNPPEGGEYGEGPLASIAVGFALNSLATLIFGGGPNGDFGKEPRIHGVVKHRFFVFDPQSPIPGSGGFIRLRTLFSAFPGWDHVVGDPDFTDLGYRDVWKPDVTITMGDWSHTFSPSNDQFPRFRRPQPTDWGLSTLVFDVLLNLKYRVGPVVPNHCHLRATMRGSWLEPFRGLGDEPILRYAGDTWTSGKSLTQYAINEDAPFHLVNGGWYEYKHPPLFPPIALL